MCSSDLAVVVLVVGGTDGHVNRRRGGGCEGGFWETEVSWDFVFQVFGFLCYSSHVMCDRLELIYCHERTPRESRCAVREIEEVESG